MSEFFGEKEYKLFTDILQSFVDVSGDTSVFDFSSPIRMRSYGDEEFNGMHTESDIWFDFLHCGGETKDVYLFDAISHEGVLPPKEVANILNKYVIKFDSSNEGYCALEGHKYELAKKYGVEQWFAQSELVTFSLLDRNDNSHIRLEALVMKRVEFEEEGTFDYYRSLCEENEDDEDGSNSDECWSEDLDDELVFETVFCSLYSYDDFQRLTEFINDARINDLHTGNFAINEEEHWFCIFDYSGYSHFAFNYDKRIEE